ncbi:MAG TPA: nuclear transport factor 2 family protein [Micromonosporaceae bacterium]
MTTGERVVPGRDIVAYLANYPQEVAFGTEEPSVLFDLYHTPDFVHCNDGIPLDRERLLAHVRPARKNAASVDVDVHDAMVDGDRVAARYTLTAVMRRGQTIATEIYMFGRIAPDGRLCRIDSVTRTLPSGD